MRHRTAGFGLLGYKIFSPDIHQELHEREEAYILEMRRSLQQKSSGRGRGQEIKKRSVQDLSAAIFH